MFTELSEIEPNAFLGPFLEVIRSEDTTGPVTGLALTSVNKFLSYGLVGQYTLYIPCIVKNSVNQILVTCACTDIEMPLS